MNNRPMKRQDQAYRRPAGQPMPEWMDQPVPEEPPYLQEEPMYEDDPAYGQPMDPPMPEDAPYEEDWQTDRRDPFAEPPVEEIIATNRTVCLTCTLASMLGLFALFLCFAEKRSRAIRTFAVQSTGLMLIHLIAGGVLLLVGSLLGMIPILGFLIDLVCWLCYIVILLVTIFLRVRMMLSAWRGVRFVLPLIGHKLEHFV